MKTKAELVHQEHRIGIAEFLDRSLKPKKGLTIVELSVSRRLQESIKTYLDSAGLEDIDGITKVIEFGLGRRLDNEFASLEGEIARLSRSLNKTDKMLASRKDKAYENFVENKAMAAELASLLSENRLLRHRLAQHHLLDTRLTGENEEISEKAKHFVSKYTLQPKL